MKKFASYLLEAKVKEAIDDATVKADATSDEAKRAVITFITSNFYRFINNPDTSDTKGLLMLIAALSTLNADDTPQTLATAKRLAQMAYVRSSKRKS
jgi:hypothetical protein